MKPKTSPQINLNNIKSEQLKSKIIILINRSIAQHSERKPKKDPEPLDRRFHRQWKQELDRAMKPSEETELKPDSGSNTTIWLDDLVTQSHAESESEPDPDLTMDICQIGVLRLSRFLCSSPSGRHLGVAFGWPRSTSSIGISAMSFRLSSSLVCTCHQWVSARTTFRPAGACFMPSIQWLASSMALAGRSFVASLLSGGLASSCQYSARFFSVLSVSPISAGPKDSLQTSFDGFGGSGVMNLPVEIE